MREIEYCDYKAQEIKHLQFQLNLAKQELDNALAELAAHKAMAQKMKCCKGCELEDYIKPKFTPNGCAKCNRNPNSKLKDHYTPRG